MEPGDNRQTSKNKLKKDDQSKDGKEERQVVYPEIKIRLTYGLTVIGAYVGPQKKHAVKNKFLT